MKKSILHLSLSTLFLLAACGGDEDDPNSKQKEDETPDTEKPNTDEPSELSDDFGGNGELIDYVTNNEDALPDVSRKNGRYYANLTNNSNNETLHYHEDQGRLDAKKLEFPFEFIARNIGIGTQDDSQTPPSESGDPYNFCGVQVHVLDLDVPSSSHVVVGHRGSTVFTIEGKNTNGGSSTVNDIGANTIPEGRADIRIVGKEDQTIKVYWQLPNLSGSTDQDNWKLYNDSGDLPGTAPNFEAEVYVGLITYAFYTTGVPFVGTCDAIEVY